MSANLIKSSSTQISNWHSMFGMPVKKYLNSTTVSDRTYIYKERKRRNAYIKKMFTAHHTIKMKNVTPEAAYFAFSRLCHGDEH